VKDIINIRQLTSVLRQTPQSATVIQRDQNEYPAAIESMVEPDVVILNGIQRVECVRRALSSLTESNGPDGRRRPLSLPTFKRSGLYVLFEQV
jgi:hypothetical protein